MDTTLTDEIRAELREGLREGVRYEQIRAKFDREKGPFYNALETVLTDIGAEIENLASERDTIAEQVEKVKAEHDRLANDAKRIKSENEAGERRVSELKQTEQNLQQRIRNLDEELVARGELLKKSKVLEGAGFTAKRLETFQEKLAKICAKRGIEPKKAADVFFKDFGGYDAKLGWELELKQLGTLAKMKASEVDRWKAESKRLELRYAGRKEIIDEFESLMKRGVRGEDILAWNRILDTAGKTPEEFEEELEHYGKVVLIFNAKMEEVRSLDQRINRLKSQVATLEKYKAEVGSSIKALADSGVKEIKGVCDRAKGELSSLMEEVRRWGEIKAEAGKLEEELKVARYLVASDPAIISLFPLSAIIFLQDKVKLWLELNNINPKVELPDWMRDKYTFIYHAALHDQTRFAVQDLVDLALCSLTKIEVSNK